MVLLQRRQSPTWRVVLSGQGCGLSTVAGIHPSRAITEGQELPPSKALQGTSFNSGRCHASAGLTLTKPDCNLQKTTE